MTPVPASERIEALDVLRGFALLGIFVMNVPGFSHSLFTPPGLPTGALDASVVWWRELLFAGKFNLLFGTLFGIGFALQTARLEAAQPGAAAPLMARRLSVLLGIGLVHAVLLWSGDVLLVYAVLGFGLLAARRLGDRALLHAIATCLVLPTLLAALRPLLLSFEDETVAAFQMEAFRAADDAALGHGSFVDAARQTARAFAWAYTSPLGLFSYATFYVQMATGILAGLFIGRRRWPQRLAELADPIRRLQRAALITLLACGALWLACGGIESEPSFASLTATLARTVGRAALSGFYALTLLRWLEAPTGRRLLRPLALAGRMPLSNYLLQTALGTFIFYGWGLGVWGRASPAQEVGLAFGLVLAVQLPLSRWWLKRFRQGPVEYLWRRLTYGRAA